ncbi:membrane protein [Desulfuromonas versatilis]|uniref:Membrane protein n=1 Tax=Desulfuromonas versatilis TaxID=2802975 RepID=A0ABN6DSM2_9BACT|nr:MMPL family transporter [Desulfuromonas versatilis]BCR03188.1 membrane protein [Desulfuromonas versatilis]
MDLADLIAGAYRRLAPRRTLLLLVTAALLGASLLGFRTLRMQENIAAMLPDGGSVAEDFQLLQQAPFASKVVITLNGGSQLPQQQLIAATDELAQALDPRLFPQVVSGPREQLQQRMLPWLLAALPNLADEEDLALLRAGLDEAGVRERLQQSYRSLLGPEGWALKGLIRQDPLGLHRLALEKLRHLNLVPGARLADGHFLSPDGKSALLVAETPVPMTDSAGAEQLLAAFEQAIRVLPEGVEASLVSGHRYTAANARAIQADLWLILSCSTLALVLLFLIFLRSLRAVFVFLVPVSVVCLAAVAVGLVYPEVSAVTIGFGAVLLGIAVDFGLHVYFALRRGGAEPAAILGAVAKPVTFGALTTVAAFAVLLFSDLPGQRQLAVFSITGILAALLLALLVLPHLLRVGAAAPEPPRKEGGQRAGRWILALWLLLLAAAGWQATRVTIDGDLRAMSLTPPALAADEAKLQQTWGQVRGRAMVWSLGADLEQALAVNRQIFQRLGSGEAGAELVSLAPLLPPLAEQEANRRRWQGFWAGEEGQRVLAALDREAVALRFSPDAFAPFRQALAQPAAPVTPAGLHEVGLGEVIDSLVTTLDDGRVGVLNLIPETPAALAAAETALAGLDGARLVAQGRFREEVSAAIGHDFTRFIVSAALAVVALLVVLFRHPGRIFAALVPVLSGLLLMLGIMGALGMSFNLFNVIAAILVIGLGVDYGIFMVCRQDEPCERATETAVLVSGLTTLAGFGALVLARHPALHSIGITVLLGIGGAIPAALLVVPALYRGRAQ